MSKHTDIDTYVEGLKGAPPLPGGSVSLMGAPLFFRSSTADFITSVQLKNTYTNKITIDTMIYLLEQI